jgi:hypothetical protein
MLHTFFGKPLVWQRAIGDPWQTTRVKSSFARLPAPLFFSPTASVFIGTSGGRESRAGHTTVRLLLG